MLRRLTLLAMLALAMGASVASCQSSPASSVDAGAGLLPADCPPSLPGAGAACAISSAETCTYYAGPSCTVSATCAAGAWQRTRAAACLDAGNAPECPVFGAGVGGPCPTQAMCTYDEGLCGCEPCAAGFVLGGYWVCTAWPSPPGCPATPPAVGSPCPAGMTCAYGPPCCDYGVNGTGPNLACQGGTWGQSSGGCDCVDPQCPSLDAGDDAGGD